MAKLVLNALVRPRREGVQAQVAELETSCAGEPISPIPQKASSQDLAVPIEVETAPTLLRRYFR